LETRWVDYTTYGLGEELVVVAHDQLAFDALGSLEDDGDDDSNVTSAGAATGTNALPLCSQPAHHR